MKNNLTYINAEKNKWKYDIPVFINFFNRPDTLKCVFEAVRNARPSKLFLSCDGPRLGNETDIINIAKCQKIVENVDWDCEVHKNYSETNLQCGLRMYSGISWAFEYVDRLIILEDDCVPNESFFPFCEEILEKYLYDQRINMISGMNHCGEWEKCEDSYFFAKTGSCWGWATWRRAWDNVEFAMPFMEDENTLRLIAGSVTPKGYGDYLVRLGKVRYDEYKSGKQLTSWTTQHGLSIWLQSQLIIIPKVNQIKNIGLTIDSTHAVKDIRKIPKGLQSVFKMETYDICFPLSHPKYVIDDADYADAVGIIMGGKNRTLRLFEGYIRQIIFADKNDYKNIWKKAKNKMGL